jgi:hypothetical protein
LSWRKYIYDHKQNAARNMNVKDAAGEVSGGNKAHVIGNWEAIIDMKWQRM